MTSCGGGEANRFHSPLYFMAIQRTASRWPGAAGGLSKTLGKLEQYDMGIRRERERESHEGRLLTIPTLSRVQAVIWLSPVPKKPGPTALGCFLRASREKFRRNVFQLLKRTKLVPIQKGGREQTQHSLKDQRVEHHQVHSLDSSDLGNLWAGFKPWVLPA